MINLEAGTVDGEPITSWVVWFRTYKGLHRTLEEALVACMSTEMPPDLIKAVPVALTATTYEERP